MHHIFHKNICLDKAIYTMLYKQAGEQRSEICLMLWLCVTEWPSSFFLFFSLSAAVCCLTRRKREYIV